ncbi:LysR family transcriptional regulator [Cupriavidus gilardii]|uniref:LysR family transcriptional regulator n=1 Tax=Cupriavidus gilardii TaxID=82541 RepID=UPI001ABE0560|nr:LysR family transcriptional regulator [Cupriavidus gilardii]MBO4123374.1 LysR family transcriptional regulator [Cupriavidus gilardii]
MDQLDGRRNDAAQASGGIEPLDYRKFRGLDLNLLVAFDALASQRSVSGAARQLFLGQPAVSHMLARLRRLFDDPLFVRGAKGMEPTAKALGLVEPVRALLNEAYGLVRPVGEFDPSSAQAHLRIALPEPLEAMLLPVLCAALAREAPSIQLGSRAVPAARMPDVLDAREIDMAVTGVPLATRDWHRSAGLHRCHLICAHAPAQLALPASVGADELRTLQAIGLSHAIELGSGGNAFLGLLQHTGAMPTEVESLLTLSRLLQTAPVVAVLPALIAPLILRQGALACVPVRGTEDTVTIRLHWHNGTDSNPVHRYVRQHLTDAFAAILQQADD